MNSCREVWMWNREEEMILMEECLRSHRFIAIDTEFPGCLIESSREATDEERYNNMCLSVNMTKIIQLGLTVFDGDGRIGGTWEINFCDFRESHDARNDKSIAFLRRNGLDFEKIREQGIEIEGFFSELLWILKQTPDITWVTFHGSYDIAYLLKYFTGESLPVTSERFANAVAWILGSVYDLKAMSGQAEGLSSRLGLESLAQELRLNRVGTAHHAGSDSELTAMAFAKMVQIYDNIEESEGYVYGICYRIISGRLKHIQRMHYEMMTRCCCFHHRFRHYG